MSQNKSYIDENAFELTDPREHEERKYRGIWQVLNCANDIYSKYKTIEALVSGIESEAYSKGRESMRDEGLTVEWLLEHGFEFATQDDLNNGTGSDSPIQSHE